jgi:hypothetical protein
MVLRMLSMRSLIRMIMLSLPESSCWSVISIRLTLSVRVPGGLSWADRKRSECKIIR